MLFSGGTNVVIKFSFYVHFHVLFTKCPAVLSACIFLLRKNEQNNGWVPDKYDFFFCFTELNRPNA